MVRQVEIKLLPNFVFFLKGDILHKFRFAAISIIHYCTENKNFCFYNKQKIIPY